ncbi:MAG: hypothetical protein US89_C0006G0030 [Candidatus Peregrinibacteria bacterium GW2011_GWF2_38_29]|nr:MAG: hypothetical protein US89_C0006G0030 [Candidatus Peregrinibacteria bacterium GW2011_GWF2_38_29]HBB03221.1 hypothetical protein [Candidatus Peregrinibacteria bacterium]
MSIDLSHYGDVQIPSWIDNDLLQAACTSGGGFAQEFMIRIAFREEGGELVTGDRLPSACTLREVSEFALKLAREQGKVVKFVHNGREVTVQPDSQFTPVDYASACDELFSRGRKVRGAIAGCIRLV